MQSTACKGLNVSILCCHWTITVLLPQNKVLTIAGESAIGISRMLMVAETISLLWHPWQGTDCTAWDCLPHSHKEEMLLEPWKHLPPLPTLKEELLWVKRNWGGGNGSFPWELLWVTKVLANKIQTTKKKVHACTWNMYKSSPQFKPNGKGLVQQTGRSTGREGDGISLHSLG